MGVCIGVVDLGTQYNDHFKRYADKMLLMFEIPTETVNVDGEEKPRWLSKEYTASLSEKSVLYKHLVSWRSKAFTDEELDDDGDGFDIKSMLGVPCMLSVLVKDSKDGGSFNNIENISAVPKGISIPKTETELMAFDIDERDESVFEKLPEWIQNKVKKSTQYADNPPEDKVDFKEAGADEAKQEEEE